MQQIPYRHFLYVLIHRQYPPYVLDSLRLNYITYQKKPIYPPFFTPTREHHNQSTHQNLYSNSIQLTHLPI